MKQKVVLIGFPGAGKTTVGRILQEQYSWKWVDVDEEVEAEVGCSITDLIREEGEEKFRHIERAAVVKALSGDADVVSLGGGALLNEETKREVEEKCLLINLFIDAENSAKRVLADEAEQARQGQGIKRPLLSNANSEAEVVVNVSKLMQKRKGLYDLAKHRIDTRKNSPQDIAGEIVRLVGEHSQ